MVKLFPSWFIFLMMLVLGVLLLLSGENFFMWWIGFELSLLGFMPMFLSSSSSIESMMKYFMVQATGSFIFLMGFLFLPTESWGVYFNILSLTMKMGMFPFFFWVPLVMSGFTWMGCLMMVTVQKVGPLVMMSMLNPSLHVMAFFISLLSIFVGGYMGMDQSKMRGLMAYSSISHSGWIVSSIIFSLQVTFAYVLMYMFLVVILFCIFDSKKVISVTSGFVKGGSTVVVLMMVLVGFPPFSMFFLKFFIFLKCMEKFGILCFLMVISTMFYTSYYMVFNMPMMIKSNMKVSGSLPYLFLSIIYTSYFIFFNMP